MKNLILTLRAKAFVLVAVAGFSTGAVGVRAQEGNAAPKTEKNAKKEEKKDDKKPDKKTTADALKNPTAEQIAESAIVIYGGLGGRQTLNQIRKTAIERGKLTILSADGKTDSIGYSSWILRGDNLEKEKFRLEQDFPNAKYSMVYDGAKIFGIYNDSTFSPREDAVKSFQNRVWHGLEALLRYKENESKLELAGREKTSGVDLFMLDVTDKQDRKTRFYVSAKTFRVMMLSYEDGGAKFKRKFYDYNYAQGTLVPFRTVLWSDDRQIEETEVGTITFGQKIEDVMFQGG